MATFYQSNLSNKGGKITINVNIQIIEFQEGKSYIIYSPHLDLSGYGNNSKEAKESFDINLEEFFSYTMNKNTLGTVLKKLGWKFKVSAKKLKNLKPPVYSNMLKENDYLSEILDNHSIKSHQRSIAIPA